MDPDDFSLIDIGHEDDSLLKNLPPDDAGGFACSPLVITGSTASSRPPKTTMIKDNVHFGETGSTMPDGNKENFKGSSNMKLGLSNFSIDRQKMKRSRNAGGCNLRKSLAWDKAFFTEEGVLSNLELSMITGTPSKLDGEDLPVIYEELRTPVRTKTNPTDLQTIQSKSSRKLPPRSNKEDRRTGESSHLKQKSLASASLKSKKLASTETAKKSGRKEGNSLNNLAPTAPTSHKRLPSRSPAKPAAQKPKLPRIPVLKIDAQFISSTANASDASQLKSNRIAPPAPSVQKHLGQKGSSNTRSTSNAPKIGSQRIPKPSKCYDQRTRKNRTNSSSQEHSSTNHQVSNVKDTTSEVKSGKILSVGLKANDGTSKVAVSVNAKSGNTCITGQSVQHQGAKPSGLRMPSPSLKFFSEPKVPTLDSLGKTDIQRGATHNVIQSKIPKAIVDRLNDSGPVQPCFDSSISRNLGDIQNAIQSKIPNASMDRVTDSSPVQPCSVSSINSPKIPDESVGPVLQKNTELVVGVQALSDEKPLELIGNNRLEEVNNNFVEHEYASPSIEDVDGKDNRSVSSIRECQHKDLVLSSDVHLWTPGMDKFSDYHPKEGQHDLSVFDKTFSLESEVQENFIVRTPIAGDGCLEVLNMMYGSKEVKELHCPSHDIDEVSPGYDGMSSNVELIKRSFSPERSLAVDVISDVMADDKLDMPLVAREAYSVSLEKIVETENKQQELQVLQYPLIRMDKPVQSDDGNTVKNDAFRIASDEHQMSEPLPLKAAVSLSFDTNPLAEDQADLSVSDFTNESDLNGQNIDFELHMSPKECKSISQVDEVICDAELSFSPIQALGSPVTQVLTHETDQQHNISDELARESLMPTDAKLASLKSELSSEGLVTFEDIKLRHSTEEELIPSTISVEPLMPDEAISESPENEESEDLVIIDDRELSYQAEFQLNSSTCEDQTIELPSLEDETMSVSFRKDMCETEEGLVISGCRELIDSNHMEMLLLPNNNGNQPTSSLHSSVDSSLSLKESRDNTIEADKLETDYQINQGPPNLSLEIEVGTDGVLIEYSSRIDKRSELQSSPRMSEECSQNSAANFDYKVSSSPCEIHSTSVRTASEDESDEQFQNADQHEVFRDNDSEDAKIKSKILKDGKNQPQLVIKPPVDVAPFSDEWLAAVEAAGEQILTLKTGAVQNSPPARLSPEPGPWSPVKRKNNQGIGPYDCTKFTGQH